MENNVEMAPLDERKRKILSLIIRSYLETGEPVGSRTISKMLDITLSSATIRNEMSDLEDMGYILQPHTSAGRIPSDLGYRFYVNELMVEHDRDVAKMQEFVIEKTEKMEKMLKNVVKALAANTNYATLITSPNTSRNKVKFIQLSQVEERQLVAVIVMEGNIVKNKIMEFPEDIDAETILKLNILLNSTLNGLTREEINLGVIAKMKEQSGAYSQIVNEVLDAVAEAFSEDEELQVYTSGATNLIKYPELADTEKAGALLSAFEDKEELIEFLAETKDDNKEDGIQVYIGNESPIQTMQDCSVVTATYDLGNGLSGHIGIVGPKRMDYENVMENLKSIKTQLDVAFKNNDSEKPN
ncbi:heat-inducible transcription repressor HrcA [Lachnospiraceae bacterium XBB1006]|nr:heat-inducible transcription repressor HrcA [Lachnospiraceae bacterium XBB1006]